MLVSKTVFMKMTEYKGHGEKDEEVKQAFKDLLSVGVDCVTLGQYLQPSRKHMKVAGRIFPENV
jgi:lipoic acid synthetase